LPPAPASAGFLKQAEEIDPRTEIVALASGKAWLAVAARTARRGVVRALADDARRDVLAYKTGDCRAGAIVQLEGRPGGVAVFRWGQVGYPDCLEETDNNHKADLGHHMECAELRWDEARPEVAIARRARAETEGELPEWCRSKYAVPQRQF
jgi:hypothetical protein